MATADFSPSLPSGTALENRLSRLARRRNAQKMSRAIVRAAIWGVALAALAVLGWKLHIIPDGPMWAPFAIIGVFVLWGVRNGWLQRAGTFAAACDADNALAWDDRLSSALAFVSPDQVKRQTKIAPQNGALARFKAALLPRFATSTAPAVPPTDLVPALVDEASARAQNLDPRRVYPLPFDRRAQILTALSLLFVGFCFMPEFPLFQTIQERRQVAAMQNAGEKLVAVAKNVRKTENPKAAEVNRLSRRLEKLGQKMVRGRMTKRAALTEIGELRQQLQKAQQKNSKAQSSAALPQIAEALRETPLQSQTGRKVQEQLAQNKWDEAAKELEKLADKVQNNQLSQSEKQKAAEDLKKTAQDLRSRGGEAKTSRSKIRPSSRARSNSKTASSRVKTARSKTRASRSRGPISPSRVKIRRARTRSSKAATSSNSSRAAKTHRKTAAISNSSKSRATRGANRARVGRASSSKAVKRATRPPPMRCEIWRMVCVRGVRAAPTRRVCRT